MANSLLTGFSGLASHQRMIEVVGNNLANLNTTGFKAQRASFADVFYESIAGGATPAQIGNGSKLASVAINFSQGGFDATGAEMDFAIDGEGFFVVSSEDGTHYTRAGAFGIDRDGFLVDSSTGYHVQRFGTTGEAGSLGPAFQTPGSSSIRIPFGASVPGRATTRVDVRGNLSAGDEPGTMHVLSMSEIFTVSGGAAATGSTLFNDLEIVTSPLIGTDGLLLSGTNHDGTDVPSTHIPVGATTTVQDVIDGINAEIDGATAVLDADGRLVVTAQTEGTSELDLTIIGDPGNTGMVDFTNHTLQTTETGADGDVVRASMEVFDEQGNLHVVGIELRPQSDGTWRLDASLDADDGTILDGVVEGITLNTDGSFQSAGVPGTGDSNLIFEFSPALGPQTVAVNFGTPGSFTSLTSIADDSSVSTEQNGYSTGTLLGVNIDEAGVVEGIASNGRQFPLAQLAVAVFRNPQGLELTGDNLFQATTASGAVELGTARSTGRGSILSGQLEQSNVDIAVEFTRLIIAQRGFSANARTITVTSEILEELTNLLR